jgi:outer membrane protein assembly factor BamB
MWHRSAAAAALLLALAYPALGQVNNVYSRAVPPDKAALDRLNLKIEWTANIPVEGRRDSLTQIQTIGDQIFVQTRTGLLIAGDALTGRLQWFVQLGDGKFANSYPVAANSKYVFAAHVTKLHAFHRYTGVAEFVTDLESPPTAGLSADESGVYCVLGMRPGNSGGHRITVFNLPSPIPVPTAPKGPVDPTKAAPVDPKAVNPVDDLMKRYSPQNLYRTNLPEVFDPPKTAATMEAPIGGYTSSRSPSVSVLPRVTPPYTLMNQAETPSIGVVSSLRRPYHMRNDFQRDIQQTPSIGVIPPSVAASLALADLRPKTVKPPVRWEYGFTTRIVHPLFLTPQRVWAVTDAKVITALNKQDHKVEVFEQLADQIGATPGRAGLFVYVPLSSGYLVALEGTAGTLKGGANILWRTPVGGIGNRTPFVTDKHVYYEGDHSGVVCLSRKEGEIIWRADDDTDRLIAANEEFVYIRDHQGRFLVYDAKRPTNATTKRSAPLAGLDLAEFNVHVVNTESDRIYLAADNGLIVCLRDMNPKYVRPVRICPLPTINAPPRNVAEPKKDAEPKKEPEKN